LTLFPYSAMILIKVIFPKYLNQFFIFFFNIVSHFQLNGFLQNSQFNQIILLKLFFSFMFNIFKKIFWFIFGILVKIFQIPWIYFLNFF
jgi:hypothetical protein